MNGHPYRPVEEFQYTPLSELDVRVMPNVAGCPRALYELVRANLLRTFCRKTHALIGTLPPMTVYQGTPEYALDDFPDVVQLIGIKQIQLADGRILSDAHYVLSADRKILTLRNGWDSGLNGQQITLTVFLTPAKDATAIEEEFFERWEEGLAAGITTQLMVIPRKSWTDPNAAAYFSSVYHDALQHAKIAVSRDFSNKPLRIKPQAFD